MWLGGWTVDRLLAAYPKAKSAQAMVDLFEQWLLERIKEEAWKGQEILNRSTE